MTLVTDPPGVTEDPADVTEDPPGVAEDMPSTVTEDGPGVSEGFSLTTASLTPPVLQQCSLQKLLQSCTTSGYFFKKSLAIPSVPYIRVDYFVIFLKSYDDKIIPTLLQMISLKKEVKK